MKDTQLNTSKMWAAVDTVLTRYKTIWDPRPPFRKAVENFRQSIAELESPALKQQENLKGITADKQTMELQAAQKADYIGNILQAYAMNQNNQELYRAMSFGVRSLLLLREEASYLKMKEVLAKAQELSATLADYGLAPEDLTALNDLLEAYQEKRIAPRDAVVQRSSATKSIAQILKEGNAQLYLMDKLINTFAGQSEDFVREYQGARIIIDAGHRHREKAGAH